MAVRYSSLRNAHSSHNTPARDTTRHRDQVLDYVYGHALPLHLGGDDDDEDTTAGGIKLGVGVRANATDDDDSSEGEEEEEDDEEDDEEDEKDEEDEDEDEAEKAAAAGRPAKPPQPPKPPKRPAVAAAVAVPPKAKEKPRVGVEAVLRVLRVLEMGAPSRHRRRINTKSPWRRRPARRWVRGILI